MALILLKATLAAIQKSLPALLFFNSMKRSGPSEDSQSRESRACLAYLLFVQLITLESFPAVFRWDGRADLIVNKSAERETPSPAPSRTDACFALIFSFKTPQCVLLSQSSLCSPVQHGSRQPAAEQVSRCTALARFKSTTSHFSVKSHYCFFFFFCFIPAAKRRPTCSKDWYGTISFKGTFWSDSTWGSDSEVCLFF